MKEMLHDIKYHDAYEMLQFFSLQAMTDIIMHEPLARAKNRTTLCITHVPMHPYKQHYIRWYNQSALFAWYLSELLQIPHVPLLVKSQHTDAQATLSREQRLQNLTASYEPIVCELPLWCDTVLVVDDVLTTWSTLEACAHSIKKHHPHVVVWWLCVARHAA
jgi:predicted amidophosphoribosyltransferase